MRFNPRRLLVIAAVLLAVFAYTIELREPWRGHLAPGEQWVTAATLSYTKAWHREGVWQSRLQMVETPPTAEYAGEKRVTKWGLPGHFLLVYSVLEIFGVDFTAGSVMWVNLAIHAALAFGMALLAFVLANSAWLRDPRTATFSALHCGAFCLLLPAALFWGQNLSVQHFSMLPLFAFCVAGRWLRESLASGRARRALDIAVAASVFLGVVTEFLFWLLIPYLIGMRGLRSALGWRRTQDRWLLTLALPYALAVAALSLLFWVNGDLGTMADRFGFWALNSEGGEARVGATILTNAAGILVVLATHGFDAYSLAGAVSLAALLLVLTRRRRFGEIPSQGICILVDLLVPALLVVGILFRHQLAHSPSAIKFLPFVALAWTVLVPAMGPKNKHARVMLGVAYAGISFWILCPLVNGFERFFPEPALAWDVEARFLRENVDTAEIVFSRSTQIGIVPPQRLALAERAVHHAYGPMDIFFQVRDASDDQRIASYQPAGGLPTLLHGMDTPERVARDGFSLARLTKRDLVEYLDVQPYGPLLQHLEELLALLPPPDEILGPYSSPLPSVDVPVSMHLHHVKGSSTLERRIHWRDEQNYHLIWEGHSVAVIEGDVYLSGGGMWGRAPASMGGPLAEEIQWARFFLTSFANLSFADSPPTESLQSFSWRTYDIVRVEVREVPTWLRRWERLASRWEAYIVVAQGRPVAIALSPAEARRAPRRFPHRALVVFEPLVGEITAAGYLSPRWSVKKR